jgi:biopolymer transport protein ExbD
MMKTIAILLTCLAAASVHAESTNTVVSTNMPTLSAVVNARTNDMVLISLDTNETIRVEGRITLPEEIDQMAGMSSLSNSTPFMIEAARNVRHYSIRRVMDSLSKQNFWKINFRAAKETAQQLPAP